MAPAVETPPPYPFRLLESGCHDGYYNMGLDEALLESAARGGTPCLRLYGWKPPAVSIGYFQGLHEEVDLDACKKHGVDVVRRISGGGAVFHQAELTYSIIMPVTHPLAQQDFNDFYIRFCGGIIEGLKLLGLDARFAPINDVLVGGRKISGNAQTRRMGCILQHGTVLLDNDVDLMFELLQVPAEKLKGKLIEDVKSRVTSLRAEGLNISFDKAAASLAEGFRRILNLSLNPETPNAAEEARTKELAAEKFGSEEWLFKR
ncbi:lipoate--protein ligase family protein [Treponema primitia]|uniref:lipoate--protein ligase family protein n=1 Tax=Treponema primitia TaxID=88058 RepID=UPI0002554C8F|nr:biotin/lipoate A/B protein ligase family protein [Treponema primitia]